MNVASIQNHHVRVVWEGGSLPRLGVQVRRSDEAWVDLCELSGKALADVNAFGTAWPFPATASSWHIERTDEEALTLSGALGDRLLTRSLRLDPHAACLHVATTITLRGDELTGHVQDHWSFLQAAPVDFAWAPHLRPGSDHVIGDHSFRAPAIILLKDGYWVALLPDLDALAALNRPRCTALELNMKDHPAPVFGYGVRRYEPVYHTYYRHDPAMLLSLPRGSLTFGYDLLAGSGAVRPDVLRKVVSFQWQRYAAPHLETALPQTVPFHRYAAYAYPTLFETGAYVTFAIDGKTAGGFRDLGHHRYFRTPAPSLWNQAWFNGVRSAYGLWHYGEEMEQPDWRRRAEAVKTWALAAPQTAGLFPALYAYEDGVWWGSPPRLNGGRRRVHTSSAAWTATWLLWWSRDLQRDAAAERYARRLADFLVQAQEPSGAIPAWFDLPGEAAALPAPVDTLKESAETGGSALFLGEMALATNESVYTAALVRAADFLLRAVLPHMKYWDFETYFSCSWKALDMRDPYTTVLPQNTYSMYWTAHTLLRAYELSGTTAYLQGAREALDAMNLYQQIWNPPFLSLYTFGGFGVMNTDGEWNDARQAVFAPMYLEFYRVTGETEYFLRGVAALRASFALMAIPENKEVGPLTWNAHPVGLMDENFAHSGVDGRHARSDSGWGEAGALAAAAWVARRYGGIYVDVMRRQAFGIDGCRVARPVTEGSCLRLDVVEQMGCERTLTLVTSQGLRRQVSLRAGASANVTIPVTL